MQTLMQDPVNIFADADKFQKMENVCTIPTVYTYNINIPFLSLTMFLLLPSLMLKINALEMSAVLILSYQYTGIKFF